MIVHNIWNTNDYLRLMLCNIYSFNFDSKRVFAAVGPNAKEFFGKALDGNDFCCELSNIFRKYYMVIAWKYLFFGRGRDFILIFFCTV